MQSFKYLSVLKLVLVLTFFIPLPVVAGSSGIEVDPEDFHVKLLPGEDVSDTFTISNTGDATLTWSVTEGVNPSASTYSQSQGAAERSRNSAGSGDHGPLNLSTYLSESLPGLAPTHIMSDVVDCDTERGLIIQDDGIVDTGYSGNVNVYEQVMFVDWFEPPAYPASFTAVCMALLTMGPRELDFDIVVLADDGPDGSPGTELGSMAVSASEIPLGPGTPVWYSYDISSLDLQIEEGGLFIGLRFATSAPPVFIGVDETATSPVGHGGGYWWNNVDEDWTPLEASFPAYRALFVRPAADTSESCMLPDWINVAPGSGSISPGAGQPVTASFDAAGLANGAYYASICLASNDPDMPLLRVPVIMEVGEAIVEVDNSTLTSTLGSDAVAIHPLTVSNLGVGALSWEVDESPDPGRVATGPYRAFERKATVAGPRTITSAPRSEPVSDLESILGYSLPGLQPVMPVGGAIDCDNASGMIINDDGTVENGYTSNPDNVQQTIFVDKFTPSVYPATFTSVCVAFTTLGPDRLDFEVVVFAGDGPDDAPATELGAVPVSIEDIPMVPNSVPAWGSYDISSLDIEIDSGSLYVGVRFTPLGPENVYLAADQTPNNPPGYAGGYRWQDSTGEWERLEGPFVSYRAMFIRAAAVLSEMPDCTLPTWASINPDAGDVTGSASQTLHVTFNAAGQAPGEYEANLCLTNNDPTRPVVIVPLSMTVVDQAPAQMVLEPSSLEFGQTTIGNVAVAIFDVLNTAAVGSAALTLTSIVASGDASFDVTGGDCAVGDSIEPGDRCTTEVSFTPDQEGPVSGTVMLEGNNLSTEAELSGVGVPPSPELFHDRFEQ